MLQNPFWDRIQKVRQNELDILWKSFRVATFNSFLLNAIPTFVSVATFTTYVLLGNKLTAAKAFTSLSLFSVRPLPKSTFFAEVILAKRLLLYQLV